MLVVVDHPATPDSALEAVELTTLDKLAERLLLPPAVHIVLSPLVAEEFDAAEVAAILNNVGYAGKYRVLSPEFENLKMVRDELHSQFPQLDLAVFRILPGEDLERI